MRTTYTERKHQLSDREMQRFLTRMLIRSNAAVEAGDGERVVIETLRRDPSDTSCRVDAGELAATGQVSFPAKESSHSSRWTHSFEFRWEAEDELRVTITDHANAL